MKFPQTLQLKAPIELGKAAADKARTFHQLAHTGTRVSGWFGDCIYDLKGMDYPARLPILQQHDHKLIVALATSNKMDKDGLHLSGEMYQTRAAKDVQELADAGFPWQASIGVRTLEAEWVEKGEEREVNGRLEKGPFVLISKSQVYESSFCPIGADTNTSSVVLSGDGEAGTVEVKVTAAAVKEEHMSTQTQPAAAPDVLKAERERVAGIKSAFPKDAAFALKHIEAGSSLLEAKAAYAEELQKKVEELETKNAVPPIPGRGEGNGGSPQGSAIEQWNGLIREQLAGIPAPTADQRWQAIRRLSISHPVLYKQYLDEYNATRPGRAR